MPFSGSDRSSGLRILLGIGQTLFESSPVEALANDLAEAFEGFCSGIEILRFPWVRGDESSVLRQLVAYRSLELQVPAAGDERQIFVALETPALLIPHAEKIVWLAHFREGPGGLGMGTRSPVARREWRRIHRAALSKGVGALHSMSAEASWELYRATGVEAPVLRPPPPPTRAPLPPLGEDDLLVPLAEVGSRPLLVLDALARTTAEIPAVFAGSADSCQAVRSGAEQRGLSFLVETVEGDVKSLGNRRFFATLLANRGSLTCWEGHRALATSRRVIACSDSGAVAECLHQNGDGDLVPARPDKIAAALDRIWSDPASGEAGDSSDHALRRGGGGWATSISQLIGVA